MSSEPAAVPEMPHMDSLTPGARIYTFTCMAAALVIAAPLLARGLGTGALLPAFAGLLLPLLRWRAGVTLMFLTLGWLAFADSLGMGPWQLLKWLFDALGSFYFSARLGVSGGTAPKMLLVRPQPVLDVLLCAALVTWVAAYCRLLSVTRNIFPIDPKRRAPSPGLKPNGAPRLGVVIEPKRSPSLTDPSEIGNVASAAVGCAALALVVGLLLGKRTVQGDLTFVLGRDIAVSIHPGIWRALVLVTFLGLLLFAVTSILSYLGHRRLTPAEAGLYLQDQLWRQTRREQARLNRWLAWAEKKEARRRARRQETSP